MIVRISGGSAALALACVREACGAAAQQAERARDVAPLTTCSVAGHACVRAHCAAPRSRGGAPRAHAGLPRARARAWRLGGRLARPPAAQQRWRRFRRRAEGDTVLRIRDLRPQHAYQPGDVQQHHRRAGVVLRFVCGGPGPEPVRCECGVSHHAVALCARTLCTQRTWAHARRAWARKSRARARRANARVRRSDREPLKDVRAPRGASRTRRTRHARTRVRSAACARAAPHAPA